MRVLLIESDTEEVLFLRDVLQEIGEGGYWNRWIDIDVSYADSWASASEALSNDSPDVLLLDLNLPDSYGMETFRRAQQAAPGIPMVVLLGPADESLALRLIREGAQDFLMKEQIDCAPLAHALRNAIERHRLLTAARASSTHDTLTGLLNLEGFLASANRDRRLAERLGCRLMIMVAEPRHLSDDEQNRDLSLVDAADHLRRLAGPSDLVARISSSRFGLTIFDTAAESVEAAWYRIHTVLQQHRIQAGTVIYSPDHPATLDTLLAQAATDLAPAALPPTENHYSRSQAL
jgi:PleD family two-component response regulator